MASKPIQILSEAIAGAAGAGAGNGTSGTTYPSLEEIDSIKIVEATTNHNTDPMIDYGDLGNGMCYLEVKNVQISVNSSGEADIGLGQWTLDTDLSLPCVIDIGGGAYPAVLTFTEKTKIHIRLGVGGVSGAQSCSFIVFVPTAFLPAPGTVK